MLASKNDPYQLPLLQVLLAVAGGARDIRKVSLLIGLVMIAKKVLTSSQVLDVITT